MVFDFARWVRQEIDEMRDGEGGGINGYINYV